MGLMSKRSSAAKQVAGSNRQRRSKRRDFTGASSGCRGDGGEGTTKEAQTKSGGWGRKACGAVLFITSIERPDCVWYHPRNARSAHRPPRECGTLQRLPAQSGSGPLPHCCRASGHHSTCNHRQCRTHALEDRKSTRLNSSHLVISYAV